MFLKNTVGLLLFADDVKCMETIRTPIRAFAMCLQSGPVTDNLIY